MMKYSIDTSSLIFAHRVNFPMDIAPGFWERLGQSIAKGDIRATELVRDELAAKEGDEDALYQWATNQSGLFVHIDEPIQKIVKTILVNHRGLVNIRKNHSGADPFVIALAKLNNGVVVSDEQKTGPGQNPKIPNVCDDLGIECIDLRGLCRREGWKFT